VDDRRLRYWERLRLIRPMIRWGEHFYDFGDLAALRTIKKLTESRVPAKRLHQAVRAMEQELGQEQLRVENLQVVGCGRSVAFVAPGSSGAPFDPISKQWVLPLEARESAKPKVHQLEGRSAEEWFEIGLMAEGSPQRLGDAIDAYRRAIELIPGWVEAHINLGVALYHAGELDLAQRSFLTALVMDAGNATARYNLGCVFEELGKIDEAIDNLKRAVKAQPSHADAHFNLALAFERKGDVAHARDHWNAYLKHEPNGTWAAKAKQRVEQLSPGRVLPAPIPFRKRRKSKGQK
jgi:tetratricopeptide (TPR) repeat protein